MQVPLPWIHKVASVYAVIPYNKLTFHPSIHIPTESHGCGDHVILGYTYPKTNPTKRIGNPIPFIHPYIPGAPMTSIFEASTPPQIPTKKQGAPFRVQVHPIQKSLKTVTFSNKWRASNSENRQGRMAALPKPRVNMLQPVGFSCLKLLVSQ